VNGGLVVGAGVVVVVVVGSGVHGAGGVVVLRVVVLLVVVVGRVVVVLLVVVRRVVVVVLGAGVEHGVPSHCPYGLGFGLKFRPVGQGMTIALPSSRHWMYELQAHGFQ